MAQASPPQAEAQGRLQLAQGLSTAAVLRSVRSDAPVSRQLLTGPVGQMAQGWPLLLSCTALQQDKGSPEPVHSSAGEAPALSGEERGPVPEELPSPNFPAFPVCVMAEEEGNM